ncbi:MAG: LOG family protein [Propioniciclava sp.]
MRHEIETLADLDARLRASGSLASCVIQALDLRGRGEALTQARVHNALFLGCRLKHRVATALVTRGATVFPRLPDVPFDAYRPRLYSPEELYADLETGYADTLDGRVYAWTRADRSQHVDAGVAQSLHDHFISDELDVAVEDSHRAVGVMGGHGVGRGTIEFHQAARLGRSLAEAGLLVLTGGGPGAMEAANLGASLKGSEAELTAACTLLGEVPSFTPDATAWATVAFTARRRWNCTRPTIGIPTWHYGHEPPNVFATSIAKYFDNAIREDMLLRVCRAGIIYVPGKAGTTQEIFQTATPNYYAGSPDEVTPMVLVGRDYWENKIPAWPLLAHLAQGRAMAEQVHLVDTIEEAIAILT